MNVIQLLFTHGCSTNDNASVENSNINLLNESKATSASHLFSCMNPQNGSSFRIFIVLSSFVLFPSSLKRFTYLARKE